MAGSTDHYGLITLEGGESLSTNGYQFTNADRQRIDQLLWLGAEGHHHTGAVGSIQEPASGPTLTLQTTGGSIPAGTRVYYRISYVDSNGLESVSSAESFIDTPDPIDSPGAPSLAYSTTGGVLAPGVYYYALTAYVDASIAETMVGPTTYIQVPITTHTNLVTLTLPSLPAGATGFNVYRRAPGQTKYFYLASVDMTVATPPLTYVDSGSVEEDCDRSLPTKNSTNSSNSVIVTHSGATPAVPVGYTWKVYRTYVNTNWQNSLLAWVVEYVSESSTIITPTYTDVGASTTTGSPLDISQVTDSPSRVLLTNGAEVQGALPGAMVGGFLFEKSFFFPGLVQAIPGESTWAVPFEEVEIVGVICSLGRGSTPVGQAVIADVVVSSGVTPVSWTSVFALTADRPTVPVGQTVGAYALATAGTTTRRLVRGDTLSADVAQAGGGATPGDEDLNISVFMLVRSTSGITQTWS